MRTQEAVYGPSLRLVGPCLGGGAPDLEVCCASELVLGLYLQLPGL